MLSKRLEYKDLKFFKIYTILIGNIIQKMENSGQMFSLWIGPNSQQLAHHFYALQAEQFFDQSEDPTEHNCIWKLLDIHGQRKKPYFLTFDTQIPHLSYLRKTNHAKLISQMEKSHKNLQQYYFPMQYKATEAAQIPQQKDKYLYQRWESSESNYALVDRNFIQDCDSFDYWKDIFKANSQAYQDKIRKNLQNFDFLKNITFCSDLQRSGFSQQTITYLKDECPKKDIFFIQLEQKQKGSFYEVSQIQSIADIGSQIQSFLNLRAQVPQYHYFQSESPFIHLAPLINSLFTPFFLKETSKQNYLSNILTNPHRNIFDLAFTLPIIDKQLRLSQNTNIFDYLLQNRHHKFFQDQEANKINLNDENNIEKQEILHLLQEDPENRVNYGSDYMGIKKIVKQNPHQKLKQQLYTGLISQSYVLKGHINSFQKIFNPNCELLDLKYLQGIMCNYTENKAKYHKSYVKSYGQTVQNYPFHSVMFQHENFGDYLRNVANYKNKKNRHELEEQWKQNILTQADYYKQLKTEDDQ